jgi:hypothetical protein
LRFAAVPFFFINFPWRGWGHGRDREVCLLFATCPNFAPAPCAWLLSTQLIDHDKSAVIGLYYGGGLAGMTINYGRVGLIGNVILASVFALLPTFLIYVVTSRKPESLASFVPLVVLITLLLQWTRNRTIKEEA